MVIINKNTSKENERLQESLAKKSQENELLGHYKVKGGLRKKPLSRISRERCNPRGSRVRGQKRCNPGREWRGVGRGRCILGE